MRKWDFFVLETNDSIYNFTNSLNVTDSIKNQNLFAFEKDTSVYFTQNHFSILQDNDLQSGHDGMIRPFTLEGDDGVFALLMISFVLFTRIYKGGFTFFKENITLLFSSRKSLNLFSETTTTEFWFNFILIFQSILITAIVVFDTFLESEEFTLPIHSFYTIILFLITISIFLLLKYLFYLFIAYVFEIKEYINVWLRNYMIVLEMMGIISFLPALMLVYSQSYHQYLLIFFLILFLISRLILFYRIITFFLEIHVNFLFSITYLCSVEIIPYLILYEVLINLYKVDIINLL